METQLGLLATLPLACQRITEFVEALPDDPSLAFAASLRCDRWGAGVELLRRRDELELADWSEADSQQFPALARDLCVGPGSVELKFPSEGSRLQAVCDALDSGQLLPPHDCMLHDAVTAWPARWQRVLNRLNLVAAPPPLCLAVDGSALREAQECVLHEQTMTLGPDRSLRWAAARSEAVSFTLVAGRTRPAPGRGRPSRRPPAGAHGPERSRSPRLRTGYWSPLTLELPRDRERRAHPFWLAIGGHCRDLVKSTRVLVQALHDGGYCIEAMEASVEGSAFGKDLRGRIDCIAVTSDGQQAVIDFKCAGRYKYRKLLEQGRAIQLAAYAHSRRCQSATAQTPAVAYLAACREGVRRSWPQLESLP